MLLSIVFHTSNKVILHNIYLFIICDLLNFGLYLHIQMMDHLFVFIVFLEEASFKR